jgi:LmbE family N-acetylglucosaminyl deacetylase
MRPTLVTFHAHPDDEAIFTGGTIALAVEMGWRVVVVVATDGEEGRPLRRVGSDLGRHRRREVSASARTLGVERVEFLGYRDSGAAVPAPASTATLAGAPAHEAAGRLRHILVEERAVAVTSYDEGGVYGHPDHVRVHDIASDAVAGTRCDVYEATINRTALARLRTRLLALGLAPALWPEELSLCMGLEESAGLVGLDVSSVLRRKLAAIAEHASQTLEAPTFMGLPPGVFHHLLATEWYRPARVVDGRFLEMLRVGAGAGGVEIDGSLSVA